MHVRLINPFYLELEQLDTFASSQAGDYDNEFNEPKVVTTSGNRVVERAYKTPIRLRCQVEDAVWDNLRMLDAGNSPEAKIAFVIDWKTLVDGDLIDSTTNLPKLHVNDRLLGIYDLRGNLVHLVRDPPGLYCVEVRPISYGIGRRLNLLLLRFNDRELGETV